MGKRKQGIGQSGKGKVARVCSTLCMLAVLWFYPFRLTPATVASASAAPGDAALVSTSTREGRLAVFDDAWERINERYYDRTFHGLNWEAQRVSYRSLAAKANSTADLYVVLRRMISSLNDLHTRVFSPEEKSDWWRPRFVSTGIAMAEVEGLPTVVQVEKGSGPQRAGVRPGDVIETVDGAPAMALVNAQLDKLPADAGAAMRFRVFARLLDGASETSVEVGWKEKHGKRKSARFVRYWQQRELGVRGRHERGAYAVFEVDVFTKAIAASFAHLLPEELPGVWGVVLDLRRNGGGDAEAMADVASSFLVAGLNLGQFTDRAGASFTIFTHAKSPYLPERIVQTKLPLIVLTSERTSSASEIFIEALRASRRATIIGTETCGCVVAVRTRHLLPDGGLLDVSELDYETAQGDRLEGHALRPDEMVLVKRSDLYAGRDRAMELAISKVADLRSKRH